MRKIHVFIKKKVSLKKITINNHTLFLDEGDSLHLTLKNEFSPDITEIFRKNVKRGDIVVDVGAHIGYFTVILADIVGDRGKVFAFEPNPKTFSILKKNIETNNIKNVVLEKLALSNIETEEFVKEAELSAGTVVDKNFTQGIKVKTTTFDKYFHDIKIDFIKIDVQGAEYNILNGGEKIFEKKPKCIIEIHPTIFDSNGNTINSDKVIKILKKYNYEIFNITKNKLLDKENIIRADLFCY